MPADHLVATLGGSTAVADELLAQAAYPGLPAADIALAVALADRAQSLEELATLHLSDLAVAHHAVLGHPIAIARLRALLEALRAPLRRTGATTQQIDELLDEVPAELVAPRAGAGPRIAGYSGRGPLAGWLRVVAVRMLVERRRRENPGEDIEVGELAAPELDPELALLRRQYACEFATAFEAAIGELPPGDRLLLRQHHLDGLGIDRLAALHGIHRATAARRVAAVREALFEAVRRRLLRELKIGGTTFDSLVRLVRSELDLGLERYL